MVLTGKQQTWFCKIILNIVPSLSVLAKEMKLVATWAPEAWFQHGPRGEQDKGLRQGTWNRLGAVWLLCSGWAEQGAPHLRRGRAAGHCSEMWPQFWPSGLMQTQSKLHVTALKWFYFKRLGKLASGTEILTPLVKKPRGSFQPSVISFYSSTSATTEKIKEIQSPL